MSINRFIWNENDVEKPLCWRCKHLLNDGECKAFPGGIPNKFLSGKSRHTKPYKGDNGVQFEPIKEAKE